MQDISQMPRNFATLAPSELRRSLTRCVGHHPVEGKGWATGIGQASAGIPIRKGSAPAGVLGKQTQPPVRFGLPYSVVAVGQPILLDERTDRVSRVP